MNNYKKYLPSKKFIAIILFIVTVIAVFFMIKGIISLFKNKTNNSKAPIKMVIGDIIQKDSNFNGIPDWEEYLWGLNPNKNGPENKEFILAKKGALAQNSDTDAANDSKVTTENEKLSQQFFATIVSLQQTGNLNDSTISSVTEAVGKNIETTPIPDIYNYNMLIIKNDSTIAKTNYENALSDLVKKYIDADIGTELTLIVQGIGNKDPSALSSAVTIAEAYQSFGKELMKIPVPKSLASTDLSIANNYEKTGQTIKDLAQALSDPIIGMKSILNYKQYSDALGSDLEKMSGLLQ